MTYSLTPERSHRRPHRRARARISEAQAAPCRCAGILRVGGAMIRGILLGVATTTRESHFFVTLSSTGDYRIQEGSRDSGIEGYHGAAWRVVRPRHRRAGAADG